MVTSQGFAVQFYKPHKTARKPALSLKQMDCAHDWAKHSMVTQDGGYDWMMCSICGCFGKRFGLGQFGVTELQSTRPISNY